MNEHNNLKQAKILFNTLLKAKLDSSPEYKTYEGVFLPIILKELKENIIKGNHEACYILAKVYETGFYNQPKDEYMANLLTLIGHKLGNSECKEMVGAQPARYENLEYTANNFINNYTGGDSSISFDDTILLASLPSEHNWSYELTL